MSTATPSHTGNEVSASGDRQPAPGVAYAVTHSLAAKLFLAVFIVLVLSLGVLGYAIVRLHRQDLEAARLNAAEKMSDVVRRSTSYYMLRNDRDALQHIVQTVGQEQGFSRLRILDHTGRVGFSTHNREIGSTVNIPGAAVPVQQSRIWTEGGNRFLGITTPIPNAPSCSSGACHAHPESQQSLGLLDINLSLAQADRDVRKASMQFVGYSALAIVLIIATIAVFVWYFVHEPVRQLRDGTERLGRGDLGTQIPVHSDDELGELARSFNDMSRQLQAARHESDAWAETLEARVAGKTAELQRAQQQMIQAEKLTSLGKLAAVVAHEINNPLSGILTYAKLMSKWIERGDVLDEHRSDMRESLQLIASESRRCGDIVHGLLTFARVQPLNVSDFDINGVVKQTIKLVEHKLELGNIAAHLDLAESLPALRGDRAQVEQLLLALIMNAIEAMPREGNLVVATTPHGNDSVMIRIEDDGVGIPAELLPRMFEPFTTTKEEGKGVGLGLAISKAIVDRHGGRIEVKSEAGRGTTFTIVLPAGEHAPDVTREPEGPSQLILATSETA